MYIMFLADELYSRRHHSSVPYTEVDYYLGTYGPHSSELLATLEWMVGAELKMRTRRLRNGGRQYIYDTGDYYRLAASEPPSVARSCIDTMASDWADEPMAELRDRVFRHRLVRDADIGDFLL